MSAPSHQVEIVRAFATLVGRMSSGGSMNPFGGSDEMGSEQAELLGQLQSAGMTLESARTKAFEAMAAIENDDAFTIARIFRTIMKNLNVGTALRFM